MEKAKKHPIITIGIIIAFILLILNISTTISLTTYMETTDAKIYVFRDEQYQVLDVSTMETTTDELTKVGANKVLATSSEFKGKKYIEKKIESIDFLLSDRELISKKDVYIRLKHINLQLTIIDDMLESALKKKDSEQINILTEERIDKQENYEILKIALMYAHMNSSDLKSERSRLAGLISSSNDITAYNLNLENNGYVSYHLDGYEDLMNLDNVESIDSKRLDKIDSTTSKKNKQNIIKIITSDKMILAARVEKDVYIDGEYDAISRTEDLINSNGCEEGLYFYLYSNVTILNRYPTIKIILKDGTITKGKLVNVIYDNNEKILVIYLREGIESFLDVRIFEAKVVLDSYECYRLPNISVTSKGAKSYITLKNQTSTSQQEVTVIKKGLFFSNVKKVSNYNSLKIRLFAK